MDKIKFGIIGFGFMGHVHEEMLTNKIDEAEVVAVCDIDAKRLEDSIAKNALKYTDVDELLKQDDINTVLIVVPNHLHKEMVIKAANAKKNIICEKPVALDSNELDEMLKAVEKNKVRFTVHQQRRFDKDFCAMKKVYDSKKLGNIYTIQSMLYGYNGYMHDWHVYKKYGGGMLYDWGVHLIDQLLYMIKSPIISVYADLKSVINDEVDDYFKILIRFKNNITAEVELGTYFLAQKDTWFERHWYMGGNKGSAYVDGFKPEGKRVWRDKLEKNIEGIKTRTKGGPTRSFREPAPGLLSTEKIELPDSEYTMFFDDYFKGLETGEEFLVKIPEIRKVMKLIEDIFKSSSENRVIQY